MEYRPLDVKLISATDLKDCQLIGKMDVYAVVSINGDPRTKQRTPVDKDCGTKPKWNYTLKFTIDEAAARENRLTLHIQLIADRSFSDKVVGEVQVPLKQLMDQKDGGGDEKVEQHVSYSVSLPNGKTKGTLNLSYKLGEKFSQPSMAPPPNPVDQPANAYPPAGGQGSPYAPPPPGAYPPSGGAYPPSGGAYPPHQPPPPAHGMPAGYPPHSPPPSEKATPYPPPAGYPYQPPPHGYAGGYPPAPVPGYGYQGYPPHGGPGYPPQGGAYGYPPMMQQPPPQKQKKHGMGMGMGLGLGAGLLGGLLVGDMVSDVAETATAFDSMDGVDADFGF